MIKKEAKFAIKFRHWLMANPMPSSSFEVKDTRGKESFPYAEFKPEQANYAEAIKHSKKGVLVRTEGSRGLPDYLYMNNAFSWIVIKYPKGFFIIDVETFLMTKESDKRKSLTFDKARAISTIEVLD